MFDSLLKEGGNDEGATRDRHVLLFLTQNASVRRAGAACVRVGALRSDSDDVRGEVRRRAATWEHS